jgi:hypothetical protein
MDERLRKEDYTVRPVPLLTAHHACMRWHYARGGSKAGKAYGLFARAGDGSCLGVAHYNVPQREQGDLAWEGGWREVWVLHRLAIDPAVPHNACTFLIMRSVRLLARDTGCRCVLSYADTWQGHQGRIYRGANWEYTGLVAGDKTWTDPRTGRLVAQRRGNRTLTDAEMAARGYQDHGYHPKHRYRLLLKQPRPARTLFDRVQ